MLLSANGITHTSNPSDKAIDTSLQPDRQSHLSHEAKVKLFRRLFSDKDDVYPIRYSRAGLQTCLQNQLPSTLEISRSGNGAHLWLFSTEGMLARDVHRLGTVLTDLTNQINLRFG